MLSLRALLLQYRHGENVLLQAVEYWLNLHGCTVFAVMFIQCSLCKLLTGHPTQDLVFTFVHFVKYKKLLLEH